MRMSDPVQTFPRRIPAPGSHRDHVRDVHENRLHLKQGGPSRGPSPRGDVGFGSNSFGIMAVEFSKVTARRRILLGDRRLGGD